MPVYFGKSDLEVYLVTPVRRDVPVDLFYLTQCLTVITFFHICASAFHLF